MSDKSDSHEIQLDDELQFNKEPFKLFILKNQKLQTQTVFNQIREKNANFGLKGKSCDLKIKSKLKILLEQNKNEEQLTEFEKVLQSIQNPKNGKMKFSQKYHYKGSYIAN
jgi:hypothetical protein